MTDGRIPWASGMKPAIQRTAETSGGGPVAVAVTGVQPHNAVERLQLGARTISAPVPKGGGDLWSVEIAGTVQDELSTSPWRCQNLVWIQQLGYSPADPTSAQAAPACPKTGQAAWRVATPCTISNAGCVEFGVYATVNGMLVTSVRRVLPEGANLAVLPAYPATLALPIGMAWHFCCIDVPGGYRRPNVFGDSSHPGVLDGSNHYSQLQCSGRPKQHDRASLATMLVINVRWTQVAQRRQQWESWQRLQVRQPQCACCLERRAASARCRWRQHSRSDHRTLISHVPSDTVAQRRSDTDSHNNIATPSEEDQFTATGNMLKNLAKFGPSVRVMQADRQKNRHRQT